MLRTLILIFYNMIPWATLTYTAKIINPQILAYSLAASKQGQAFCESKS